MALRPSRLGLCFTVELMPEYSQAFSRRLEKITVAMVEHRWARALAVEYNCYEVFDFMTMRV